MFGDRFGVVGFCLAAVGARGEVEDIGEGIPPGASIAVGREAVEVARGERSDREGGDGRDGERFERVIHDGVSLCYRPEI